MGVVDRAMAEFMASEVLEYWNVADAIRCI